MSSTTSGFHNKCFHVEIRKLVVFAWMAYGRSFNLVCKILVDRVQVLLISPKIQIRRLIGKLIVTGPSVLQTFSSEQLGPIHIDQLK